MASGTQIEKQSVAINFNDRPYVPPKYVFEMDDRTDEEQVTAGAVRIRQYPAFAPGSWSDFYISLDPSAGSYIPVESQVGPTFDEGLSVVVTEGSIQPTREWREKYCYGTQVVNGDTEITLQYPVMSGLRYGITGDTYDVHGRLIHVSIGFDLNKNALVLSKPAYGVVWFEYTTSYRIHRYFPATYNDYEIYLMPDPQDYGQLLAFIKQPIIRTDLPAPSPIVFSITPPETIASEFELYRVESSAFAKDDGLWEKPSGWPTNGTYPSSTSILDTGGSYVEVSRTHEIGYFSILNNAKRQENTGSIAMSALPLDFTKELKYQDYAGGTVRTGPSYSVAANGQSITTMIAEDKKVQAAGYFNAYKKVLNSGAKMRVVRYEVPVAKPYTTTATIANSTEFYWMVVKRRAGDTTTSNYMEKSKVYKIKLTIKAAKKPAVTTQTVRNSTNKDDVEFNTQALRLNTMLSMIWEGIDWKTLRKKIQDSYDPDIYQLTFDTSFPMSN